MIIWIDGTYGVGKTTVATKLKECFSSDKSELLLSDYYWKEFLKRFYEIAKANNCFPNFGGTLPQYNIQFINEFKTLINKKEKDSDKKLIIDMALTTNECKENLFDNLKNQGINIVHIILMANEKIIKSRILNDDKRDDLEKREHLSRLPQNISFLNDNYSNAIRIQADNHNPNDITDEIAKTINLLEKS